MRVRLRSDGTPAGTTVTTESGEAIRGITQVIYTIGHDGDGQAEIDLHPRSIDIDVLADWHPTIEWANAAVRQEYRVRLTRILKQTRDELRDDGEMSRLIGILETAMQAEGLLFPPG